MYVCVSGGNVSFSELSDIFKRYQWVDKVGRQNG